eukprot:COSAG04_NODE_27494_length_282_cov_1.114754_1_plen_80_part_10
MVLKWLGCAQGPYVSFTKEDRGSLKNLTGGFGQSPGPVTALQGNPINVETVSNHRQSMADSFGISADGLCAAHAQGKTMA